jgi:putative transposase
MRVGGVRSSVAMVPRRPRIFLPWVGTYHVTSRGVARQAIFRDADDYAMCAALLRLATRRWQWHVLAYCLMPNHFHLVVTADLERLSRGMHLLNFRYARAFNDRYDRVGHLFQGRFDAYVIETDDYFVSACAYVLENAARAGLCATRDDWPWVGGEVLADLR